jgi:hypothetical protein
MQEDTLCEYWKNNVEGSRNVRVCHEERKHVASKFQINYNSVHTVTCLHTGSFSSLTQKSPSSILLVTKLRPLTYNTDLRRKMRKVRGWNN